MQNSKNKNSKALLSAKNPRLLTQNKSRREIEYRRKLNYEKHGFHKTKSDNKSVSSLGATRSFNDRMMKFEQTKQEKVQRYKHELTQKELKE